MAFPASERNNIDRAYIVYAPRTTIGANIVRTALTALNPLLNKVDRFANRPLSKRKTVTSREFTELRREGRKIQL